MPSQSHCSSASPSPIRSDEARRRTSSGQSEKGNRGTITAPVAMATGIVKPAVGMRLPRAHDATSTDHADAGAGHTIAGQTIAGADSKMSGLPDALGLRPSMPGCVAVTRRISPPVRSWLAASASTPVDHGHDQPAARPAGPDADARPRRTQRARRATHVTASDTDERRAPPAHSSKADRIAATQRCGCHHRHRSAHAGAVCPTPRLVSLRSSRA